MAGRGRALLRWAAISVAISVGLAGVAAAAVYAIGEMRLDKRFDAVPVTPLRVSKGNAQEGARLVRVLGCAGCHGTSLAGEDFYGTAAPNLTRMARAYDRDHFARLLRTGVRADGTSVVWAMPSDFFAKLADDQIAHIYAYLRSIPQAKDAVGPRRFGLAERFAFLTGSLFLSAEVSRPEQPAAIAPKASESGFGAYFTSVACAECHGFDLAGGDGTPPLALAIQAYTPETFAAFLKTGKTAGGMDNLMMSGVARGRLSILTNGEVSALYTYLSGLPVE